VRERITLACGAYDRTAALADGRVQVEGVDLNYLPLSAEEIFFRMTKNAEFDVAEMSLSSYTMSVLRGRPFVAVPVFPSRTFRHHGVYVRSDSDYAEPADLRGRTIGIPEYQMTAAVWIRGILEEHHGLPVDSVRYRTGGLLEPGRTEKLRIDVEGVDIAPIPAGATLSGLLESGELDAVYTARTPRGFGGKNSGIRRLWSDPMGVEADYFRKTGVFPIMHTVVMRADVYERNRWLARSLMDAFTAAKGIASQALTEVVALANLLPWGYQQGEQVRELMGADPWPYGIEANRACLTTFLSCMHAQKLTDRLLSPEEIFAPETHDAFVV
jgi:4,5-dihydroxyphthalate decarboxylase